MLTSWSTLSVAMHWLLARVLISRLLGVSIRQLQRGTSWRPSVSSTSGPLASPKSYRHISSSNPDLQRVVQRTINFSLYSDLIYTEITHQHCSVASVPLSCNILYGKWGSRLSHPQTYQLPNLPKLLTDLYLYIHVIPQAANSSAIPKSSFQARKDFTICWEIISLIRF